MADPVLHLSPVAVRRSSFVLTLASLVVILPTSLAGCRLAVEPDQDVSLEPFAAQMLEASAAAWNQGDLEAFLSDYQHAPSTTYVGSRGVLSGIDEIRDNYAARFEPGAQRDSLRYESVRVRSLQPMLGIVTARWVLHDQGVIRASGPTTLVMRRTGSGWKIIYDHSSADSPPGGN